MELKKMPNNVQYYYLSKENSEIYDRHKDSNHWKDKIIVKLIMQLAEKSRGGHASSKY